MTENEIWLNVRGRVIAQPVAGAAGVRFCFQDFCGFLQKELFLQTNEMKRLLNSDFTNRNFITFFDLGSLKKPGEIEGRLS